MSRSRASTMTWGWVALMVLGVGLGPGQASAQEPLGALSPEAQDLITWLDSKDAYLRQKAFLRLEALREPATAAVVRRYLTSRDVETRAFSVRALAAIEGAGAIPTLVERLKRDRKPRVRVAAVLALEPLQTYDPSVLSVLIEKLRDRNAEVRMAVVDVVSRVDDPKAKEAIRTRWKRERHRDVQRVLEQAMKRISGSPS